jgi:hypothetical protein
VAFQSAYKVGSSRNKLKLFKNDGSINKKSLSSMKNNFIKLPIKGFKIQQDIPYHDYPGEVNRGTQESKLLFNAIRGVNGFNFSYVDDSGNKVDLKDVKGSELEKIYIDTYRKIYEAENEKLIEEIYENGSLDLKKLHKLLLEEAISRDYSSNDILGLALNEDGDGFKFPLWSMPESNKYESLLLSIIDNRVRKLKMPGNSYVLGTETGFKMYDDVSEEFKEYQDRIIYTSAYDPKIGLQSFRKNDDGRISKAQVFVPNKINKGDGTFIDIMKYTYKKDGRLYIDEKRLPKSVTDLFGFRIPTQGHNSMAAIEIAGFLPESAGDLIIATKDFIAQMGSDKR